MMGSLRLLNPMAPCAIYSAQNRRKIFKSKQLKWSQVRNLYLPQKITIQIKYRRLKAPFPMFKVVLSGFTTSH